MSIRQEEPFAALIRLADLERARSRNKSPDPKALVEMKLLLSRPLVPLASLPPQQRGKLKGAIAKLLQSALADVSPAWLDEYAAAAVVELSSNEKYLRTAMIELLLRDGAKLAHVLKLIGRHLRSAKFSTATRRTRFRIILQLLSRVAGPKASKMSSDLETAALAFFDAAGPTATPQTFAEMAGEMLSFFKALFPDKAAQLKTADDKDAVRRIQPLFGDPLRMFLKRPNWGTFAREISATLRDHLWRHIREAEAAAASEPSATTPRDVIREAAWAEADEALAHALQDTGSLNRAFEKLEAIASGDVVARTKNAKSATKMVLQWVWQAAEIRNIALYGAAGERAPFDPVFHISDDAEMGEEVRVIKPPIVRQNGSRQIVLLRGEVESF